MKRVRGSVGAVMLFVGITSGGCPGKTTGIDTRPDAKPDRVAALDQSFLDYDEIELIGTTFEPSALGRPGMISVTPSTKTTLARQRRKVQARNARPEDVHILVSMLWEDAGKPDAGNEVQNMLRKEALEVLRQLYARVGDNKASDVTLQMLASANVWAQDWTAAEAAYRELLNRFGEHPNRASFETALVVLYLQRSRFTDAFEIASRWNVEATDALGAYALAWLHFVKGESEAARQAMLRAAASWEEGGRRALGRDLVIVLARTGTDVETATSAVAAFAADKPERRLRLLDKLSTQYQRAGRFLEASQVLESLATATGEIAPTKQRYVDLSLRQAEFQILLGKPVESATLVVQAHKALASCSPCPEALRERVDARISQIAIFFHNTYHDSLDAQFYDAAETLYSYLMTVPGADADARRGNLANLKDTRDRANPASGKHNAEVLYRLAVARSETVRACYESVLLGDRTLDGSLILRMEIDHAGEVTGAATEPAAGLTGLPQVAGCVLEHVREWRFPSRTVPGTTTMRIPFVLRRAPATGT